MMMLTTFIPKAIISFSVQVGKDTLDFLLKKRKRKEGGEKELPALCLNLTLSALLIRNGLSPCPQVSNIAQSLTS